MRNRNDWMFDVNLRLKDAYLVAASAAAQVSSSNKILDMGLARFDARAILDFTAIEVDTGNELYTILVQGSSSSSFASSVVNLGAMLVGHSSTSLETVSSAATQRREIAFTNEVNGVVYQYIRVYVIVAGTIATGINFTANMVVEA